ncbi:MAG TPA: hypothetical protein VMZ22_13565 [Acidimicrobiales bacterium]|nr:hypothetical protein [Acidimicrobiales bacterium]
MGIFRGTRRFGLVAAVAGVSVALAGPVAALNDVTPPTVALTTPAPGSTYAQNATVIADYACSDSGSGIAACVGTVPDGDAIPTQKLGPHEFFASGYDNAGNKTKVERTYTVLDKTKPVVTINSPANGASYAKNSVLTARYSCYDTGVGIASCVGTAPNGSTLNTSTPGTKSFTVTAKDLEGNTTVKSVTYKIV